MSGTSKAARRGILIKDGVTLEALAGVKQVFLDKTGTLPSSHARLQSIEVNGLADTQHLLGLTLSSGARPLIENLIWKPDAELNKGSAQER